MRAVQVTDAEPLLEKKVVNKQGHSVFFNLPVAVEVIFVATFRTGKLNTKRLSLRRWYGMSKTHFTIRLDQTMLSWFRRSQGIEIPFQTVDDILKICQEFAQDQWDEEHYYWQNVKNNPNARDTNNQVINLELSAIRNFYEAEDCPYKLRIGWASGMTGTTVNLVFDDDFKKRNPR
jgi:CRISPR-associated protein Csm5